MFWHQRPARKLGLTCISLLLLLHTAVAQDQTSPRPRIGLALSGGGARGLAHIGVLQWMYEHHIPVDDIAGTSMGGVIAAMYATGMSPADMRKFVDGVDWDEALLSQASYDQLSFRRKQDHRGYQVGIPLGLKHGLSAPNGFSPGQGVGLLFDRIAFPYSTVTNYDDLPTPFRCVATNMLTGRPVVLQSGSLGQALRATMAIPGVFTPIDLNGEVLADGGLVNNIPTGVVREMKADVVIAVDVGTPLGGREDLQTLGGILDQSISVMTIENDRRDLRQADLVISPDLGQYTRTDYRNADALIRLGYQSAERKAAVLKPFAVSKAEWQQYLAARAAREHHPEKEADVLEVTGVSGPDKQHLEQKLRKSLHKDLNTQKLETRLTRITGEGRFDRLGYEGFVQNGVPGLRIVAHEKTYGPPFVDLAVDVNGYGVGAFNFSAGARVTFMDVRNHGGEWRNDLLLGSSSLAATEFYQPLGASHFFVAPYAYYSKLARNAFSGDQRVAVFADERTGGGVDIGFNSGRRSEFRWGYQIFNGDLAPIIGETGLPHVQGSSSEFRMRYVWDSQDSPAVPSRGLRLVANLSHVLQSPGTTEAFNQLEVRSSTFVPVSDKTSMFVNASFGTTFHRDAGPFQLFSLGGPFHLGAYARDEFLANHYAYAALGFRRELYRLPQLVGNKVYWGGWYEAGSAFNDPDSVRVRGSINLGVIAETILGPVALDGSISPTGETKVNFSIGRLF
jgi:NTE family protein